MKQYLFPLALCCGLLYLGRDYYRAIRNDIFELWNAVNSVKGEETGEPIKPKGEKDETAE